MVLYLWIKVTWQFILQSKGKIPILHNHNYDLHGLSAFTVLGTVLNT